MKHAEDLAQCKGALGGYGKKTGKCGDTIEFYVTEENGILKTVSYKIDGCAYTESCACTTALLAEGKSVEQAWEITPDNIFNYLFFQPRKAGLAWDLLSAMVSCKNITAVFL